MDMLRLHSLNTESAFIDGLNFQKEGRYLEAINCYDKAIEWDNSQVEAHNNKGLCLIELNRKEEAIECFNKTISLDQQYVNAYNNKGVVLSELNRRTESIECYNQALNCGVQSSDILTNKGLDLQYLGRHKEAQQSFQEAIEINGQNVNLYLYKARSLVVLGQQNQALELYKKVVAEFDPYNIDALNSAGVILFEMGRGEEALQYFNKLLGNSQYSSDANNNIGIVLLHLKRYQEAKQCFSESLKGSVGSTLSIRLNRAKACLAIGDLELAEDDLKTSIKESQQEGIQKQDVSKSQMRPSNNVSKVSIFDEYNRLEELAFKILQENEAYSQKFPEKTEFLTRNGKIFQEQLKKILLDKTLESLSSQIELKDQPGQGNLEAETNSLSEFISNLDEKQNERKQKYKNESAKQKNDFLCELLDSVKTFFFPSSSQTKNEKYMLIQTTLIKKEIAQLEEQLQSFLKNSEQELLIYSQVFYWMSLNMFILYLKMHEEALKGPNIKNLLQSALDNSDQLKDELRSQQDYLKLIDSFYQQLTLEKTLQLDSFENTPILGDVAKEINDLVLQIVYQDELKEEPRELSDYHTQSDQVYLIIQVIFNKFVLEKSISIKLAQVVLTIVDLKRVEILYATHETRDSDEEDHYLQLFEKKINAIQSKVQSELKINDYYNRGVKSAIRDFVLLTSYLLQNSDQTIKLRQTPISKTVKDLYNSKAFESLLKVKQQKLKKQATNKENISQNNEPKQQKNNCSCTIFLINNFNYDNPLINHIVQSKERLSSEFIQFLLAHI